MQNSNPNKCVYIHKRQDGTPFYIGIGNQYRPYNFQARTQAWHGCVMRENGLIDVEIVAQDITSEEALEIEARLILEFGRIGYEENGLLVNKAARGLTGTKQSIEHRRKRSLAMQGKNLKNRHSDEAKAKIGEASRKMWEERRRNRN